MRRNRILGRRPAALSALVAMLALACPVIAQDVPAGGDAAAAPAAGPKSDPTEIAQSELARWVETERAIARQRRDTADKIEMVNQQIKLLEKELEQQNAKTAEARQAIADALERKAKLKAENAQLKEVTDLLTANVKVLEARTKALLQRVPEYVLKDPLVEQLSQGLPENPEETKEKLSARYQKVIGILNQLNKLSREIRIVSEKRTLPNGTTAEVTAVYIGFGQAYYVGANDTIAGIGRPTEKGWEWMESNDLADEVAAVVSILRNEKPASFVQLPIEIK